MNFKKIAFFCVMALIALVSCSDDDDDKVNNSIVGTWTFAKSVAAEVKTNSTTNDAKIAVYVQKESEQDFKNYTYTFTADNKVRIDDSADVPSNGTYVFEGGKLTLTWGVDDFDKYDAAVVDGVLHFMEDYTEDANDLELDELIALGITDFDITITKAIAKISFARK